jgi:hypothetical protein
MPPGTAMISQFIFTIEWCTTATANMTFEIIIHLAVAVMLKKSGAKPDLH